MNITNVLGRPNQFSFAYDEKKVFQSYNSICAIVEFRKVTLGRDWDYSRTTLKHLKSFLGISDWTKKQIEEKIKCGEFRYDENLH